MAKQLVSLITGGGKGIGKAISIRMSRDKPVLIIGRTESSLIETVAEIRSADQQAEYLVGDLKSQDLPEIVLKKLSSLGWSVDSLILNAGIGKAGPADTFDLNLYREILELSTVSNLALIQVLLKDMIERRSGSICFINSIEGIKAAPFDCAYSTAKFAQIGLMQSLAKEHGSNRISVTAVCPNFVESDMTERTIRSVMERNSITYDQARERVEKYSYQKRIITPEEVAECVHFLCSPIAISLSGSPLVMSGGGLK